MPSREGRELEPLDRKAEMESFDLNDTLRTIGDDDELEAPPAGIKDGVVSSERSDSSNDVCWPALERLGGESFLGDCSLLSAEILGGGCSDGD